VSERAHAGPAAVARDSILPGGIGQDRVDDPRSLPRALVEVALGALLDQRPILPVVAGMTECRDQIAVAGEGLRQDAVPELAAADAVTEQDQCLDLVDRFGADGGVERERSHGDGSRRGQRRVVQGDRRRGRIRCRAGHLDLHPAGLVGVRMRCDEKGGQRGQDAAEKAGHGFFQIVVVFQCRTRRERTTWLATKRWAGSANRQPAVAGSEVLAPP
jgi:hypothetical protein